MKAKGKSLPLLISIALQKEQKKNTILTIRMTYTKHYSNNNAIQSLSFPWNISEKEEKISLVKH